MRVGRSASGTPDAISRRRCCSAVHPVRWSPKRRSPTTFSTSTRQVSSPTYTTMCGRRDCGSWALPSLRQRFSWRAVAGLRGLPGGDRNDGGGPVKKRSRGHALQSGATTLSARQTFKHDFASPSRSRIACLKQEAGHPPLQRTAGCAERFLFSQLLLMVNGNVNEAGFGEARAVSGPVQPEFTF
jgi:hypothetical protein